MKKKQNTSMNMVPKTKLMEKAIEHESFVEDDTTKQDLEQIKQLLEQINGYLKVIADCLPFPKK